MESLPISKAEAGFRIEGYPDAIGLVPLHSREAKRLAHLALHRKDLEFALACLMGINDVKDTNHVLREALWRSSIVHYFKCFGKSSSRFQLQSGAIYKNEPKVALDVFRYFKSLRDKHLVHDENSYAQSTPVAVLNRGNKPYKIEKIVCISMLSVTLSQPNFSNLEMLIRKATEWVVAEFDRLTDSLTKELEEMPFEELLRRLENVSHKVPTADDVHAERAP